MSKKIISILLVFVMISMEVIPHFSNEVGFNSTIKKEDKVDEENYENEQAVLVEETKIAYEDSFVDDENVVVEDIDNEKNDNNGIEDVIKTEKIDIENEDEDDVEEEDDFDSDVLEEETEEEFEEEPEEDIIYEESSCEEDDEEINETETADIEINDAETTDTEVTETEETATEITETEITDIGIVETENTGDETTDTETDYIETTNIIESTIINEETTVDEEIEETTETCESESLSSIEEKIDVATDSDIDDVIIDEEIDDKNINIASESNIETEIVLEEEMIDVATESEIENIMAVENVSINIASISNIEDDMTIKNELGDIENDDEIVVLDYLDLDTDLKNILFDLYSSSYYNFTNAWSNKITDVVINNKKVQKGQINSIVIKKGGSMPSGIEYEYKQSQLRTFVNNNEVVIWAEDASKPIKAIGGTGNLVSLFEGFANVTTITGFELVDTSEMTTMAGMFNFCSKLTNVNLSNISTAKVENMSVMFNQCKEMRNFDLSKFNTVRVTDMSYMFSDCNSVTSLNLNTFRTSFVENMTCMFRNCAELKFIYATQDFDVNNVVESNDMFSKDKNLTSYDSYGREKLVFKSNIIDKTNARIYKELVQDGYFTDLNTNIYIYSKNWEEVFNSEVADENNTLQDIKMIKFIKGNQEFDSDYRKFYSVNGVEVYYHELSKGIYVVFKKPENDIVVYNCKNLFQDFSSLTEIINFNYLDTKYATDMSCMFANCNKLWNIDLSNLNISNAEDLSYMFDHCESLNQEIKFIDCMTPKLINANYMFGYCTKLKGVELANFGGPNIVNMEGMFAFCENIESIMFGYNKFSKLEKAQFMFAGCTNLKVMSLGKFDFSNLDDANKMFFNCINLKTIYAENVILSPTNNVATFLNCNSIVGSEAYDESKISAEYSNIYFTLSPTDDYLGYFGDGWFNNDVIEKSAITKINIVRYDSSKYYGEILPSANKYPYPCIGLYLEGTVLTIASYVDWSEIKICYDSLFSDFTSLETIENLQFLFNTSIIWSGLYTMTGMFSKCEKLDNISIYYDKTHIQYFDSMFYYCKNLKNLNFNVDTTYAISMSNMFCGCSTIEEIDFSYLNVLNLEYADYMFSKCYELKKIYVSENFYNRVIPSTKTFEGCTKLKGGAGTLHDGVHDNTTEYMRIDGGESCPGYFTAKSREDYILPCDWFDVLEKANIKKDNIEKIIFQEDGSDYKGNMFLIDGSNGVQAYVADNEIVIKYDSELKCRKLYADEDFGGAFAFFTNLKEIVNLELLNTERVTSAEGLFAECQRIEVIDISSFNLTNLEICFEMFKNCNSLRRIQVNENVDFSDVNTTDMFADCGNIIGQNKTTYNHFCIDGEYAIIDMGSDNPGYFSNTYVLNSNWYDKAEELHSDKAGIKIINIIHDNKPFEFGGLYEFEIPNSYGLKGYYDTFNKTINILANNINRPIFIECTTEKGVFEDFVNVVEINGLNNIDTWATVSMSRMFKNCEKLTKIDTSRFETDNVKNMTEMFYNCSSIESIDMVSFNVNLVNKNDNMFSNCTNLKSIFIGQEQGVENKYFENIDDNTVLFDNCNNLIGQVGTKYIEANVKTAKYARLDDLNFGKGYFSRHSWFDKHWFDAAISNGINKNQIKSIDFKIEKYYPTGTSGGQFFDLTIDGGKIVGYLENGALTIYNQSHIFASKNADSLFEGFTNLEKITHLSNIVFDYSKNVEKMFYGCNNLKEILVDKNLNLLAIEKSNDMFTGCDNLMGENGTVYDNSKTDIAYARIDTLTELGYFSTGRNYKINKVGNLKNKIVIEKNILNTGNYQEVGVAVKDQEIRININKIKDYYDITKLTVQNADNGEIIVEWYLADVNYRFNMPECDVSINIIGTLKNDCALYYTENVGADVVLHFTKNEDYDNYYRFGSQTEDSYLINSVTKVVFDDVFNPDTINYLFYNYNQLVDVDFTNLDTSNVKYAKNLFEGCERIKHIDINDLDFSKLISANSMFANCILLEEVKMDKVRANNVSDINYMFQNDENLREIDLLNFLNSKTASTTSLSIKDTFYRCKKLERIYCYNIRNIFDEDNIRTFYECERIIGHIGTSYDPTHVDQEYAHVDEAGNPGYFSIKLNPGEVFWGIDGHTLHLSSNRYSGIIWSDNFNGEIIPDADKLNIKKVIIRNEILPLTCYKYFYNMRNLESIENIENLKI